MPVGETPVHISHFTYKVGGAEVGRAVLDSVLDCSVENSLHLPDMCTLRVHDSRFEHIDASTFREGAALEVWAAKDEAPFAPLFHGEIASLELDLAGHGVPTLLVRAYDKSHRLHRGRASRTFVQTTDADIVQKVGTEAGFTVHADPSPQVHDWVMQTNQTNWEFLTDRAARNGFRLYVKNERDLYFRKVEDGDESHEEAGDGGSGIGLEWGKNLRSFRVNVAASSQVDEVQVRGWDAKNKQSIIGRAQTPQGIPQTGEPAHGGAVASRAFGPSRMVVTDRPIASQNEADALARSLCDDIGGGFMEAEGLCYGQPDLKPGMKVEIKNIGGRFSGKYLVTSTTHTYTPAEGYTTQFTISGKRTNTVTGLMDGGGSGGSGATSGGGGSLGGGKRAAGANVIVVGIVTDNKDPENLGRVKIKYPWLTEEHTSFWARIATPFAGKDRGFHFMYEINDEVLVALEHGEISRPYVIGGLWSKVDTPAMPTDKAVSGQVVRRRIRSRLNHRLTFFDTPDNLGGMTLKTNQTHRVELNDKDKRVLVQTKNGQSVLLDDQGDQIVVKDKNGNQITISSKGDSISLKAKGDISIEAGGTITIKGKQVNIN